MSDGIAIDCDYCHHGHIGANTDIVVGKPMIMVWVEDNGDSVWLSLDNVRFFAGELLRLADEVENRYGR